MKPIIALTALFALSACLSQVKDAQKQSIAVVTPGVENAQCTFTNSRGEVEMLYETPGNVTITRGGGKVTVLCKKTGYIDTIEILEERKENITYVDKAVDTVGLVYDPFRPVYHKYPSQVVVLMEPDGKPKPSEWRAENFHFRQNIEKLAQQKVVDPEEEEKRLKAARELLRAQELLREKEIDSRKDSKDEKDAKTPESEKTTSSKEERKAP